MNKLLSFLQTNSPLLIVIPASLLLLINLGGQNYTTDEPETINVAKTIAIHRIPSAWDGNALFTITGGKEYKQIGDALVWTWHPWLQHYLAFLAMTLGG